jgi:hypothetical protein
METRRTDRIDRGPCPRGLCEHIASMHIGNARCASGPKDYYPFANSAELEIWDPATAG